MKNVRQNFKTVFALNPQTKIGQYDFPFTLNLIIGCLYFCKYCFSPKVLWKKPSEFFQNVELKMNIPALLEKELKKLSVLPQYLKRVQINEANDIYHPLVINEMKKLARDLMQEILEIFQQQADKGNYWMLHILTKSNLILNHLPIYKEMKDQIQIEISFCSGSEAISRKYERYTPTVKKRLETIEELSKNGIFVRVMAMPFYGDKNDVLKFKEEVINRGAQAFKHKSLNYYSWDDLNANTWDDILDDKLKRSTVKKDDHFEDVIYKSGELWLVDDKAQTSQALMPIPKTRGITVSDWSVVSKMSQRLTLQNMSIIHCGYSDISKIDWGYIK
jgi:DNA repair photolyase